MNIYRIVNPHNLYVNGYKLRIFLKFLVFLTKNAKLVDKMIYSFYFY
jgi:hypothetical protein